MIKPKKIAKIFAVILMLYSLIYILGLIFVWIAPDLVVQRGHEIPSMARQIEVIIIICYLIFGGVGLFMTKKWALYLVSIGGILIFINEIIDSVLNLFEDGSIGISFALIILGVMSGYLLIERKKIIN